MAGQTLKLGEWVTARPPPYFLSPWITRSGSEDARHHAPHPKMASEDKVTGFMHGRLPAIFDFHTRKRERTKHQGRAPFFRAYLLL
jgi:hypothetical protein